MKKRNVLSRVTAVVLAAGLLAGCSGGSGTTGNSATAGAPGETARATAAQNPESNPGEVKTITVYSWEASLREQNDAVIKAFEEQNPGIKVNMQYPVENDNVAYTEKVDMLLLSGESIDAILESSVAKCVSKVQRNLYLPLEPYMEAEGIKYDDVYSVSSEVDGSHYALPIDVTPWFIMINKDRLDEAGLAAPGMDWTWEDYREYANQMTYGEGQDKKYGSYFHTFQNYGLMGVYSTKMDNAYYKADGSLNFDDPNIKDWLQFRYEMENEDECSISLMDIKTSNLAYRNEFFSGNAAMVPCGSWMLAEIKDVEKWPHDFQTIFAPLPKWGSQGVEGRTFSDTKMFSIPKSAKHPEEAYKFIRFYTTEGAYIRAGGLTAEKNMDIRTILPTIVGENPDAMYDMESIYAIFDNPKLELNAPMMAPVYNAQIDTLFVEEIEKYLVGGETLEECIDNLVTRGEEIVKQAQ